MPQELVSLVVQAPLVGIFILFVLEWSKRMQTSIDNRDKEMRDFLKAQRDEDREVLRSVSSEMARLSALITNSQYPLQYIVELLRINDCPAFSITSKRVGDEQHSRKSE